MPEKEFLNGIAFSNLAGSRFTNFLKLVSRHHIEPKYYWRALLNGLISLILSLLSLGDKFVYFLVKRKLKVMHPPVFILGHWRSGTIGGLRMGLHLGAYCVGCCWGFMALGFAGGVMNLLWMGLATLFMVLEKLPQIGHSIMKPMGFALILAGIAVIAYPAVIGG